jgi:hypothetical protein
VNMPSVSGVPDGLILQLLQSPPSGLDPAVLATAMNAHPDVTGRLLANLQPSVISNALNANPNLLPDLLAIVDPALITQTMLNGDNHLMKHLELHVKAKAKVPIMGWMTAEANLWTVYATSTHP